MPKIVLELGTQVIKLQLTDIDNNWVEGKTKNNLLYILTIYPLLTQYIQIKFTNY
jgi:hypothetical protein